MTLPQSVKEYRTQFLMIVTGTLVGFCIGFAVHEYLNPSKESRNLKREEDKELWRGRKEFHRKGRKMFETGEMSFSEIREDSE